MLQRLMSVLLLTLVLAVPAYAVANPGTSKRLSKSKSVAAKVDARVKAEPEAPAPVVLSPAQMAIAEKVLLGRIQCELSVVVTMRRDERSLGRFLLETSHKSYVLEPVVTSTGAVRLEDAASGAVWLQLANKSMLMNQKEGKRIADDCMNADQLLVAQALARSPVPGLLDEPSAALVPVVAGGGVQEMVPNATK